MSMTPVFTGHVENGKLIYDAPHKFTSHLETLEGKKVEITVRKLRTQRSQEANRYYWGIVLKVMSDYTGYDSEDCHEILKRKFLTIDRGTEHERSLSTAKLSSEDFWKYLEDVKNYLGMLGLYVPEPNEVTE
jgi:hypothetical protein